MMVFGFGMRILLIGNLLKMFNSNVQPKVRKTDVPKEPWDCMKCSSENAYYMRKCGVCNERRPH